MVSSGKREVKTHRYIVISGIDGSGKSTIIKALQARLGERGLDSQYVWMRYNHILVKPVHAMCRLVGLSRRYPSSQGSIWRHEFYRSQAFCSFYILLTWLDTWLGRWRMARRLRNGKPQVVICDRWVNDILVDLAVDSRREELINSQWYSRFQRILPPGAKQFVITRGDAEILACRPECREDPGFAFRQTMYRRLCEMPDAVIVINNDGTVEQSLGHLMTHLES